MIAVVEPASTAARSGVDDADIAGTVTTGAAAHAAAQRFDGERARQTLQQFVEVDANHAPAVDAHCEQFEVRGEFR